MEAERKQYELLYSGLREKVKEYLNAIRDVGFAETEYRTLNHNPETPEELLEVVSQIINTSRELNQIIEQSPSSIYVADVNLNTLRINKGFEELTGVSRKTLIGRNTNALEAENIFNPSVCALAMKEERRVVVQQCINDDKNFVTAGIPVLNENGKIFRIITNALLSEEGSNMSDYLRALNSTDQKKNETNQFIAVSRQMKDVLRLADLVKDTESTIIIEGETGVGKSVLARYIHNTSNRKDKKMMEINCGAIPAALLESELFGYASGAFTGASARGKAGLIEICEGGTILLDEISELPLLLQVKLLHFLQNRKITRVGGTTEITVDVRVIAATNRPLELLVEKGEFRQDLYYRLNVVPVVIPPLRERTEDIMPAAEYFIEKYTKLYNKKLPLEKKYIDFFKQNEWRGNLRELENCVERLVVTEGLVPFKGHATGEPHADIQDRDLPDESGQNIGSKMADVEKNMIIEAYRQYGSSYKVAKALGISQSTAYRKIKKYTEDEKQLQTTD